jgi:hypothetical protein
MATKKTASASASVRRINAKIDAINRGKNPASKKAARNPIKPTVTDRKKQLPDFRYLVQVEGTGGAGDWFSEAAFRLLSRAEEYAHALHKKLKTASVRVLARD